MRSKRNDTRPLLLTASAAQHGFTGRGARLLEGHPRCGRLFADAASRKAKTRSATGAAPSSSRALGTSWRFNQPADDGHAGTLSGVSMEARTPSRALTGTPIASRLPAPGAPSCEKSASSRNASRSWSGRRSKVTATGAQVSPEITRRSLRVGSSRWQGAKTRVLPPEMSRIVLRGRECNLRPCGARNSNETHDDFGGPPLLRLATACHPLRDALPSLGRMHHRASRSPD
jgi:hypothetical protein